MKTLAEIRKENRDREYADALRRIFSDEMIAVPGVLRKSKKRYMVIQLDNCIVYKLEGDK